MVELSIEILRETGFIPGSQVVTVKIDLTNVHILKPLNSKRLVDLDKGNNIYVNNRIDWVWRVLRAVFLSKYFADKLISIQKTCLVVT